MISTPARRSLAGVALLGAASVIAVPLLAGAAPQPAPAPPAMADIDPADIPPLDQLTDEQAAKIDWKSLTDAQWKARMTPLQYKVMREEGTERSGTGQDAPGKKKGVYDCAACGLPLYDAETKFQSGTGWPSFYAPIGGVKDSKNVGTKIDKSWFSTRTEVHCNRCGGHLGHVFEDGPRPTGLRYCMNSVSLKFDPAEENKSEAKND
ncbi:peptide-methionine (R)-S-oxide reductase MsrB [Alienimonas chondri]|uniref:peptide-methionine (R)-S-oxide reductase n=1 Tax=Alienimonas chondri TaxID=2681879 RepID=A0ABX1VDT6_9PLAN|nr:peptide-methionine (R)-S-oxide reductase MsrB [Alienimonas chondri]NNJ25685.1 Peptide methionine sulfoxide reductase MsrB [Alienimonas chondri]